MKQVYQKRCIHKFNKEKDQNNYFRAKTSQSQEKLFKLKRNNRLTFKNRENLFFFLTNFIKVTLPTHVNLRTNCQLFLLLTL